MSGASTSTAPTPQWWQIVYERLLSQDVRLIAHVPDAALSGLIQAVETSPSFDVVRLAREEEGVGVLAGGYLGGRRGALMMQSSGLGNCVNALGGLALAYQVPMLLLLTVRGRLGEFNPSQVPMGQAIEKVLEALGIEYVVLERLSEVETLVDQAIYSSFANRRPIALIVSSLLTGGKRG